MQRIVALRAGTAIGLGVALVGIGVLTAYAASEVFADPSLSLADGYWIGRLPWTPIGVGMAIGGATLAAAAGTGTALLAGGVWRRSLALLALVVVAFWWALVAMLPIGLGGAWCGQPTCTRPAIEPITMAYSTPEQTATWLLLPALVISLVALTAHSRRR